MIESNSNNNSNNNKNKPFTNIFGDENTENNKDENNNIKNNSTNATTNNSLITPDILLEQLAYVDNFMPTINQDFMNLDSWILNESENNSDKKKPKTNTANGMLNNDDNSHNTMINNISSIDSINDNNLNNLNLLPNNPFGLDEQLAVELSAFADDAFIFADEEKPAHDNSNDNNENDNNNSDNNFNTNNNNGAFESFIDHDIPDSKNGNNNNEKANSHFLTQRKNTFLTSQYDNSKARYSSGKNKLRTTMESLHNSNSSSNNSNNDSHNNINSNQNDFHSDSESDDSHDHDKFISLDDQQNNSNNNSNNVNSTITDHIPSISSPLSNLLHSVSDKNNANRDGNISIVSTPSSGLNESNIKMPDYSSIPTISLVALLPRITVPEHVHQTLIKSGFRQEQIDALSAIIAYNEKEKADLKKINKRNGVYDTPSDNSNSLLDNNKFFEKLSKLDDSNPLKTTSKLLFSLLQNEMNKKKKIDDNTIPKPENINDNSKFNPLSHDADYINSLIESRNREVNNLKNKLDKESRLFEQNNNSNTTNSNLSSNIHIDNIASDELGSNFRKRSSSSLQNDDIPRSNSFSSSANANNAKRKFKGKELEESIQELTTLATTLQQKITTLELENKLLKDLVNNSGELKGLERAESIKQDLLKKVNGNK